MDPLTAFSLACNVIQVVDFSNKILAECRQIYKDGATSNNKNVEDTARQLMYLATDLKLPVATQSPGSAPPLYHDDQELLELAKQCSKTATNLVDELQKLSIQGRQRKRDAFRKAITVIWKKDAIENIQSNLEQYRRTLDTRILISLRQHVHLALSEQSHGFEDLDRKIQNLIIGVSKDQSTFDDLKDLIRTENTSNKEHISQEFQKHREITAADESYQRLLESLSFPDMDAREEGIDDVHKQTFEWIFDRPGHQARPWDNFINWLERGNGTYWISGKAGSGKSTLMNFICHDPRTDAALRIWSGTTRLFTPHFFFWNPGSQLQKSLAGLLRSLIFQIMKSFPHLMPVLTKSIGTPQHGFHQLPTWTEKRLRATLQSLLSSGPQQYCSCIFIDGLDEFNGDDATLLSLIRTLGEGTHVKFCLSSRPHSSFERELGSSPMLKLQDLTEPDIRKYVSDRLEGKASWTYNSSSSIDVIVEKALGVFLWVRLVVRDQLEGIENGDDTEQLRERLLLLPTEIEDLYGHMLNGIQKIYRKEVAQSIRLVLDVNDEWSLFTFALAEHKCIDDILLSSSDIAVSDIRQHCRSTRERIATTCKGFLEVHEVMNLEVWQKQLTAPSDEAQIFSKSLNDRNIPLERREELTKTRCLHDCTRVEFLHRTAFDFFNDNEQGKAFLKTHATANPHPQVLHSKALLAVLTNFPISMDDAHVQNHMYSVMRSAAKAENETGAAQPALMDIVDRSVTLLWEQNAARPSDIHWCRTWGFRTRGYMFSMRQPFFELVMSLEADSEFRNSDVPAPHMVYFLGFVAWCGLDQYVEHVLVSQSGWRTSHTLDYLLRCSAFGLTSDRVSHITQYLNLMSALLKRGADPNIPCSDMTAWNIFLWDLQRWCKFPSDRITLDLWMNTAKKYLESGAKVNSESPMRDDIMWHFDDPGAIHSDGMPPITLMDIMFSLHGSARSILQKYFATEPKFLEIEDLLIASGGDLSVRCTKICFALNVETTLSFIDIESSKQQLSRFEEIFQKYPDEFVVRKDSKIYKPLELQITKLLEEVDIRQLYGIVTPDTSVYNGYIEEEDSQEE